jgi:antitoxin ParD1/3/4
LLSLALQDQRRITIIGSWVSALEKAMASSVDLGGNLEKVVTDLVTSGRYNSRSEILREGVRLVQERERRLEALDAAIARGRADIEAGRLIPLEDVAAELDARYAAMEAGVAE